MGREGADAIVISDSRGNYFVVPREHLQLSKVAESTKPEVERLLSRKAREGIDLGDGLTFVGLLTLPEEKKWTHFSPDIAWPN